MSHHWAGPKQFRIAHSAAYEHYAVDTLLNLFHIGSINGSKLGTVRLNCGVYSSVTRKLNKILPKIWKKVAQNVQKST
jgi:hypothetical protein